MNNYSKRYLERRFEALHTHTHKHTHTHICADVKFPGEMPLEECSLCGMKVPSVVKHAGTEMCSRRQERMEVREQIQANKDAKKIQFTVDGNVLGRVDEFAYLGSLLGADEDDSWRAVSYNLRKARQRWGQISRILAREGATPRVMGYFYKAIVQAVLLYAAETWVLTERMMVALNTFHHRVARYIAGDHIQLLPNGEWELPRSEEVLEKSGLHTIEEYVRRRKQTITPWVRGRPIFERCLNSKPAWTNVNQKVRWE